MRLHPAGTPGKNRSTWLASNIYRKIMGEVTTVSLGSIESGGHTGCCCFRPRGGLWLIFFPSSPGGISLRPRWKSPAAPLASGTAACGWPHCQPAACAAGFWCILVGLLGRRRAEEGKGCWGCVQIQQSQVRSEEVVVKARFSPLSLPS